jgi:hypothetical protein
VGSGATSSLSKSRCYSTTFGALRAERQRWRIGHQPDGHGEGGAPDLEELEIREWAYQGSGYKTAGDVCLARNVEDELRLGRVVSLEATPDSGPIEAGP